MMEPLRNSLGRKSLLSLKPHLKIYTPFWQDCDTSRVAKLNLLQATAHVTLAVTVWAQAGITSLPNMVTFLSDIAALHFLSLWKIHSISEANVSLIK